MSNVKLPQSPEAGDCGELMILCGELYGFFGEEARVHGKFLLLKHKRDACASGGFVHT